MQHVSVFQESAVIIPVEHVLTFLKAGWFQIRYEKIDLKLKRKKTKENWMQTLFGSHTVYIILLSAFILTPNAKTNQNEFHNLKINFRLIQHYLAPPASVWATSVTFPPEIHLYSMDQP